MTTVNVFLPEALKSFVNERVGTRGYSTSSEYIRELIQKDYDRERLRDRLLAGAASPRAGVADVGCFDRLREGVREAGRR